MSEVIASILNIFTMLWIIFFATYLTAELSEQKIRLLHKVWLSLITWNLRPLRGIKAKRVYLWCYLLIPALILNVLVIARQFRIGKMYIRADFSFVTGALLWIALPMFVIGIINKSKK